MSYNRIIVTALGYYGMLEHIKSATGWLSFDTETIGLHLKADKPFLLTLTFDNTTYAVDERFIKQEIFDSMEHFHYVFGHNVKFDLHMLANIGIT